MKTPPNKKHVEIISEQKETAFIDKWYDLADENHFWMEWRLQALLKQINSVGIDLDSPLRCLDIGCGRGTLGYQIEKKSSWIIDGVDLDISALEANKMSRGELFFYNILEKNPRFENKYDIIFLYDVLEHIEDTNSFIDSCFFQLKENGYLFINVPAVQKLWSTYDLAAGHLRRYSTGSLTEELSSFDTIILDIKYWGFSLIPFLLLRKILTPKNGDKDSIIQKGFKPPLAIINSAFKILMTAEINVLKRAPIGTSVMAIVRK